MRWIYVMIGLLFNLSANAQLDTTFGDNGSRLFAYGIGNVAIDYADIDEQGNIITIGYNTWGIRAYNDVLLRRFKPDGSLDSTFGYKGNFLADIGSRGTQQAFVKVDPQGKYVFGATIGGGIKIGRLQPDGSWDTTFAEKGIFSYKLPGGQFLTGRDDIQDMSIDQNGNIFIAIRSSSSNFFPPMAFMADGILKLTPEGTLDEIFGQNGLVFNIIANVVPGFIFPIPGQMMFDQNFNSYSINNDSLALANFNSDFFLVKRNSSGNIDQSFGNNGSVYITQMGISGVYDIKVNSGGEIFLLVSKDEELRVLKLKANGQKDTQWGRQAGFSDIIPEINHNHKLLLLSNQIIIYGASNQGQVPGSSWDATWMTTVFMTQQGIRSSTIGLNGRVDIKFDNYYYQRILHLIESKDNALLLCGFVSGYDEDAKDQAIVKINKQGLEVQSFGKKGRITHLGAINDTYQSGYIAMRDGSLVVTGFASNGATNNPLIAKHKIDGTLDASFGKEGLLYTPDRNSGSGIGLIGEHKEQSVLVILKLPGSSSTNVIRRLLSNGEYDNQWAGGTGSIILPEHEITYLNQVLPDHTLRIVSVDERNTQVKILIQRWYTAEGLPDTRLAGSGQRNISISGGQPLRPHALKYYDDRLAFAGSLPNRDNPAVCVFIGQNIDFSFGQGGYINDFQSGYRHTFFDPTGNIYILGSQFPEKRIMIKKYDNRGRIVSGFGVNGEFLSSNFPEYNVPVLSAIIPDENDSLLVVGDYRTDTNGRALGVFKITSDGIPDDDFGLKTSFIKETFDFGRYDCFIHPVNQQLIVTGNSNYFGKWRYFISRWDFNWKQTVNTELFDSNLNLPLKLFPNPATNMLQIEIDSLMEGLVDIQIYDITGKSVVQHRIYHVDNVNAKIIRLQLPQTMSAGLYFLQVDQNGKRGNGKFFKQ